MVEVSIDWLSFSFNSTYSLNDILSLLNIKRNEIVLCVNDQGEPVKHNGYNYCYSVDDTSFYIMDDNHGSPGIHISISGKALLCFYEHFIEDPKPEDIITILSSILPLGHVTRLDIAIDDIGEKYYSVDKFQKLLEIGAYISTIKQWSSIRSRKNDEFQSYSGKTLYIGKRSSDRMLRVYDKKLEHDNKLPNDNPLPDFVTRFELELKNEPSHVALSMICDQKSISNVSYALLTDFIRLINFDNSKKSRCTTRSDWLNFTKRIPGAKITHSKKITSIDQKESWLTNQTARSIAIVSYAKDKDFTEDLMIKGKSKLTPGDYELIQSYKSVAGAE